MQFESLLEVPNIFNLRLGEAFHVVAGRLAQWSMQQEKEVASMRLVSLVEMLLLSHFLVMIDLLRR